MHSPMQISVATNFQMCLRSCVRSFLDLFTFVKVMSLRHCFDLLDKKKCYFSYIQLKKWRVFCDRLLVTKCLNLNEIVAKLSVMFRHDAGSTLELGVCFINGSVLSGSINKMKMTQRLSWTWVKCSKKNLAMNMLIFKECSLMAT